MRKHLILVNLFSIIFASGFTLDWSRNHVWKFHALQVTNGLLMDDFDSVLFEKNWLMTDHQNSGWLETEEISVGNDFVVANAFINMKSEIPGSGVRISLKDAESDETIKEQFFTDTGKMELLNVFNKQIKMVLELIGQDVRVFSFGLTRKPEIVMKTDEVIVLPDLLFYQEESLKIDFTLHFPAFLDVILFDKRGKIIDYIAQRAFFREGENTLFWEPESSSSEVLISGAHVVYFKVRSIDGKMVEITKPFVFVHY